MQRFHDELQKWLKQMDQPDNRDLPHLRKQLQAKAQRLADAVAEAGHSPALLAKLRTIEWQIADIDQQTLSKPRDLSVILNEARQFVYTSVLQIKISCEVKQPRLRPFWPDTLVNSL